MTTEMLFLATQIWTRFPEANIAYATVLARLGLKTVHWLSSDGTLPPLREADYPLKFLAHKRSEVGRSSWWEELPKDVLVYKEGPFCPLGLPPAAEGEIWGVALSPSLSPSLSDAPEASENSYGFSGLARLNKIQAAAWLSKDSQLGLPLGAATLPLPAITCTNPLLLTQQLTQWLQRPQRPCLFLDRDGILMDDRGYVQRAADVHLIPEAVPLIRWAKEQGWWVIVLSNQSGIARGYFSEEELSNVSQELAAQLQAAGASIDAWYYCPFHPKGTVPPFNQESLRRKPGPGMLLDAMADFPIILSRSFMVGDKDSDALAMPGLRSFVVQGRYELPPLARGQLVPDLGTVLTLLRQEK